MRYEGNTLGKVLDGKYHKSLEEIVDDVLYRVDQSNLVQTLYAPVPLNFTLP